jgi:hypothetical protein
MPLATLVVDLGALHPPRAHGPPAAAAGRTSPAAAGAAVARVRLANGAVWDLTVRTSGVLDEGLVPAGRDVRSGEWFRPGPSRLNDSRQNGGVDPGGRSGEWGGGYGDTSGVAVATDPVEQTRRPGHASSWRRRLRSVEAFAVVVAAAILLRGILVDVTAPAQRSTFVTVFVSVVVAGLPFVVLGSVAVAAIAAFVPRAVVAGPPGLAGLVRVLTPSAGVSRRTAAVAGATFLLASPAASPVVLAATAVAFPGQPMMVLARFVAGVVTTAAMGGLWLWLTARTPGGSAAAAVAASGAGGAVAASGAGGAVAASGAGGAVAAGGAVGSSGAEGAVAGSGVGGEASRGAGGTEGWPVFWERCRVDVVRAGGVLAIGALAVAAFTVWLPAPWLEAIAHSGLFAVVAMALLAFLLSVRAGADAFVAAALSQFPAPALLAFLVVGPAANLRLFTRQVARLGPGLAVRFAPAAFLVALVVTLVIGWVVL